MIAIPTPTITIDATGVHVPTLVDYINFFAGNYRAIYGQDVYLENDSQDGEWIAVQAQAAYDTANSFMAAYNAYSPATAVGAGLSSIVKLNGIKTKVSTFSIVDLKYVGVSGSIMPGAVISQGVDGTNWIAPAFTIPYSGEIIVTAQADKQGDYRADPGSITAIKTVYAGLQTVTNPNAASPGAPIEQDAQLRIRQSQSVSTPAANLFDKITAAIAAISGVTEVVPYQNNENSVDANGLPGHSISIVVTGGDATAIANAIQSARGAVSTYGNTQINVTDAFGVSQTISFARTVSVGIAYIVALKTFGGYTDAVAAQVKTALANYTNALDPGTSISPWEAAGALKPFASPSTFRVESLYVSRGGATPSLNDVSMLYYEQPTCSGDNVGIQATRAVK